MTLTLTVLWWLVVLGLVVFLWLAIVSLITRIVDQVCGRPVAKRVAKTLVLPLVLPVAFTFIALADTIGTWFTLRRVWWSQIARFTAAQGLPETACRCSDRALTAARGGVQYWTRLNTITARVTRKQEESQP